MSVREHWINVRVNPEELARIREKQKELGIRNTGAAQLADHQHRQPVGGVLAGGLGAVIKVQPFPDGRLHPGRGHILWVQLPRRRHTLSSA